ncbi:unnamed protein product [Darwinula stevensoni]|uniref:Uncharacterized protein n=1 Tax=Darwinula stevensoni TaxID=69355 RepID=A0A7R8X5M8_9CRUS|nr:unnamed protein product [Darwinula stevensoni]CAG0880271.1 unnamed protein product [Darwinula stevensoni]
MILTRRFPMVVLNTDDRTSPSHLFEEASWFSLATARERLHQNACEISLGSLSILKSCIDQFGFIRRELWVRAETIARNGNLDPGSRMTNTGATEEDFQNSLADAMTEPNDSLELEKKHTEEKATGPKEMEGISRKNKRESRTPSRPGEKGKTILREIQEFEGETTTIGTLVGDFFAAELQIPDNMIASAMSFIYGVYNLAKFEDHEWNEDPLLRYVFSRLDSLDGIETGVSCFLMSLLGWSIAYGVASVVLFYAALRNHAILHVPWLILHLISILGCLIVGSILLEATNALRKSFAPKLLMFIVLIVGMIYGWMVVASNFCREKHMEEDVFPEEEYDHRGMRNHSGLSAKLSREEYLPEVQIRDETFHFPLTAPYPTPIRNHGVELRKKAFYLPPIIPYQLSTGNMQKLQGFI